MGILKKNSLAETNRAEAENREQGNIDQWIFPAVKKKFASEALSEARLRTMEKISRMDQKAAVKNLYAQVLLSQSEPEAADQPDSQKRNQAKGRNSQPASLNSKKLSLWPKTSVFKEAVPLFIKNLEGQFQMAGLMAVMSAFLSFLFVWAVIEDRYLINFSVDAIVGIAALFFLIHNLRMQLRLIRSVDQPGRYLLLDVSALALSFLFRMWLPAGFDVSLAIFIICFFIEKKWFSEALRQTISALK